MESTHYLDFELRIVKQGQRYLASVIHSPCGEASAFFKLPFSKLEIENFVLRMESTRRGMRRISTPEMETVRQFGSRLFEAVFSDEVRLCFASSKNEARNQGAGLRLKIRLDAPELINIPWEFLYDPSLGRFLGLFEDTPIVRYIEMSEQVQALAVKPPLSILVMIANPADYPPLDVQREKENLQEALKDLIHQELFSVTWVESATLPALAETLLRKRFHIFHYIGHGGFAEESKDGILVLENKQGQGEWVSGERLAYLLGNHPSLRLVTLNACEGGRTSSNDPFAGIAMTLVRTGSVPAVVAMQLAITDAAAVTFGRGFFTALSVGKPVDAAVTQARLAIFASGNDVEWGTPVLYMRSLDGCIFDIQELPRAAETDHEQADRAERLRTEQAQAEAQIRQEQEAARKAEEERQAQLSDLYTQSLSRLDKKDWPGAIGLLEQILEMQPGYLNAAELLAKTKEEQGRAEQQALELHKQQEAAQQRQGRLTQSYAHAFGLFQAQNWGEAVQAFQVVFDLDPNYSDGQHGSASDLLARARLEKERSETPQETSTPPTETAEPSDPANGTHPRAEDEFFIAPTSAAMEPPLKPASALLQRFWRGLGLVAGISLLNLPVSYLIQILGQSGNWYFFVPFTSLASILFGPWVGGFVSAINSWATIFFLIGPRIEPIGQVLVALPITFLVGMLPGLLVKDARKWIGVLAAGFLLGTLNLLSYSINIQRYLNVRYFLTGFVLPYLILLPLLAWLLVEPIRRWGWYWRDLHPNAWGVNNEAGAPVLVFSMGWCFVWGISFGIAFSNGRIFPAVLPAGILSGLVCGIVLWWKNHEMRWYHLLLITIGWASAMSVSINVYEVISWNGPFELWHWIVLAIAGLIGGVITALVLRWRKIVTRWQQVLTITGGWSAAMVLGQILAVVLFPWLRSGWDGSFVTRYFVTGLFSAAVGAGIMFWATGRKQQLER